jgi:hypothetical protein
MNRCVSLIFAIIFLYGCAKTNDTRMGEDQVRKILIEGVEFELYDEMKQCGIRYSRNGEVKTIAMNIPWPCDFHRALDGEVRKKKTTGSLYLLLESSNKYPGSDGSCETHIQGIKLGGDLIVSSEYHDKVASCPPFQWDDKMFTGLYKVK